MGSSAQIEVPSGNDRSPFSLDLTFSIEYYENSDWHWMKQGHITIQDIQDNTWSNPIIDWQIGSLTLDAYEIRADHYRITINPAGVDTGYDADTQATRNNFRDGGQTPSGFWAKRDGSFMNSATHKFVFTKNSANINAWPIVSPSDFGWSLLGNIAKNNTSVKTVNLNNIKVHVDFDADNDGHWSNTRSIYLGGRYEPSVLRNTRPIQMHQLLKAAEAWTKSSWALIKLPLPIYWQSKIWKIALFFIKTACYLIAKK